MVTPQHVGHISTVDLKRYHLDTVATRQELAVLDEHLLWCRECLDRLDAVEAFLDRVEAGRIPGYFDADVFPR